MKTGPWLLSRRADLLLFGGSTLLALALLAIGAATGDLGGDAPPWLFLLAVVGVDVAHVWATAYRIYADPIELSRRTSLYVAIPAAAYVAGVVLYATSALLFWRVLAYLAVFHFVRQQYGWVSLYRRKNGEGDEGRLLDSLTIYAATVAPLIHWHASPPRRFHWFVANDFLVGLPEALGPVALALLGVLLTLYAVKECARAARGLPVSFGKSLVVATTALTWVLGIVVLDSDYAFTVTNVLTHGIPYFGLVLATTRQRAADRGAAGVPLSLADRAAAHVLVFLLPLLLVAFLEEWGWDLLVWHDNPALFRGPSFSPSPPILAFLVPLLALPQATHYLLDAWIWRIRSENREAQRAIGLAGAGAA